MVRPSRETNAELCVEAYEAVRAPGITFCSPDSTVRSPERTAGELTDAPAGSVTVGTSGAARPP